MGVHVLLLPFSVQGHFTPVLQLADVLASQQGFLITLVLNAQLRAVLEAASSPLPRQPNIRIQVLHDGLDAHPSLTPSIEQLMASSPVLQQSLETLLQAVMASPAPATCLIASLPCTWAQPVARKFNIRYVDLCSSPAFIYCTIFFHQRLHSAGLVPFKGRREETWITCIPGLPPMKASDYIQEFLPTEEEEQADPEKYLRRRKLTTESSQHARDKFRILVNSVYSLERQAFDALCGEHVPVCAIGPLALHNLGINEADQSFMKSRTSMYKEDSTCLQWIGTKASASTLYVAFGSGSKMDITDMLELAYGLEASGHNFLWVIRPGSVLGDISVEDVLPEGFQERVGERCLVVSWAPQTDVLAHCAIGGFFSHCGWNSTLESLCFGIPILAWPQRVDQPLIRKYIEEEWKVGIGLKKNEEGKICRIAIENGVRSLMHGEVSARIRQAGKEVQEVMLKAIQDGGSSRRNLDQFIQELCSLSTA